MSLPATNTTDHNEANGIALAEANTAVGGHRARRRRCFAGKGIDMSKSNAMGGLAGAFSMMMAQSALYPLKATIESQGGVANEAQESSLAMLLSQMKCGASMCGLRCDDDGHVSPERDSL